ncbi:hypothetical protein RBA03_22535, partial [Mycobacteroides abscessus subsp. massiliense]
LGGAAYRGRGGRGGAALILLQYLNIRTAEAVWEIVGRYFTDTMISDRSRLFVDDIINYLGGA